MEVARWMTKNPVTVESNQRLSAVRQKMDKGNFHRVPVVDDSKLVGMISDRDLRQHAGTLDNVKVNGVMTKPVVTVTPTTMLDRQPICWSSIRLEDCRSSTRAEWSASLRPRI